MCAVTDAFKHPGDFAFVCELEAAWQDIRAELCGLAATEFAESPDSLTTVADGYDETAWFWYGLFGHDPELAAHRARCPVTAAVCADVPGLVNAGFSRFGPGTNLYPHRGELQGVLRCHLPLLVPDGDCALAVGGEVHRWQEGRCLIFDDTFEHRAWNRGDGDRVVLLLTFAAAQEMPGRV